MKKIIYLSILFWGLISSPSFAQNFLHFDGSGDYVNCGTIMPATYTKEAWIYIAAANGLANNVISGGNTLGQHAFWVPNSYGGNSYKVSVGHNGDWDAVIDPNPIAFGSWEHYAVTYDNITKDMFLYKNGNITPVSSNLNVPSFINNNNFLVGSYDGSNFFNGLLDEIRVWNIVRTPTEIAANYNMELTGNEAGLVVYYKFNQGTCGGTNTPLPLITDSSPNGNNGTMNGFAGTGCTSNFVCGGVTPCNLAAPPVSGGAAVPTLGQWGLIILTLLLLTFGTIAIRSRQSVLAGTRNSNAAFRQLPFDKALFIKILLPLSLLILVIFSIAISLFGYELTSADIPGSLIAVPMLAYLLHLLGGEE